MRRTAVSNASVLLTDASSPALFRRVRSTRTDGLPERLPEALRAVLRASPPVRDYVITSDPGGGLTIPLRPPPPVEAGAGVRPPEADPFEAARALGNVARRDLLTAQGDTWSAQEVAHQL